MAKQEIKFKVTIKELSFEYEGSREVGQALQAGLNRSLGNLLDTQRMAMALPPVQPSPQARLFDEKGLVDGTNGHVNGEANGQTDVPPTPPMAAPASAAEKVRKPRKTGENSPKHLLRTLKAENFFKEPRSLKAISDKLAEKGRNFETSAIAPRLMELTQKGELHRQDTKEGYVYKDTPFNDSPRPESPPVEPTD